MLFSNPTLATDGQKILAPQLRKKQMRIEGRAKMGCKYDEVRNPGEKLISQFHQ
jgi:hypothetical protein